MEIIFFFILPVLFIAAACLYAFDPKGWNATFKRLATVARANLEAGKPVKAITAKTDKTDKDKWTAEFEGKALEAGGPTHEIVRTWYSKIRDTVRPFWECKCGESDWHYDVYTASVKSEQHVKDQNKAEELLARNGGTHAW